MKRLLIGGLLFILSAVPATWDDVKGTVTLKTIADASTTVLQISSADSSVSLISVTVFWQSQILGSAPERHFATKYILWSVDPLHGLIGHPVLAVFDVPESQITGISITELHPGQAHFFGELTRGIAYDSRAF